MNSVFETLNIDIIGKSPDRAASILSDGGILYVTGLDVNVESLQAEAMRFSYAGKNDVSRLKASEVRSKLPHASEILFNPIFQQVASALLGNWLNHNSEIFVQKSDSSAAIPSAELHFDKRRTFKVWLYPFNVDKDAHGAMRVVPNSNRLNTLRRKKYVNFSDFKDRESSVHRPDTDEKQMLESSAEQVFGAAGTVFLQDTDAWHGATPIKDGFERIIYRAHTRKTKLLIPFS